MLRKIGVPSECMAVDVVCLTEAVGSLLVTSARNPNSSWRKQKRDLLAEFLDSPAVGLSVSATECRDTQYYCSQQSSVLPVC